MSETPRERWPVPLLVALTAALLALGLLTADSPHGAAPAARAFGDGGPLVTPGNLRAALEASSELAGSDQVLGLRVSPDDVQAEWLIREERKRADGEPATLTSVRRTDAVRGGRVTLVGSDTIDADPGRAVTLAEVPFGAPSAIGGTIAAGFGLGAGTLDYVLFEPDDEQWAAFLDQETDAIERLNPLIASLDGNTVEAKGPGAER